MKKYIIPVLLLLAVESQAAQQDLTGSSGITGSSTNLATLIFSNFDKQQSNNDEVYGKFLTTASLGGTTLTLTLADSSTVTADLSGLGGNVPTCTTDADLIEWDTTTSEFVCVTQETVTGLTLTELSYVDATSSIQTQLNTKSVEIAAGTAALGTSEIADGACASAVTVSATGVATTDIIDPGYPVTPVGVTGYDPTANSLTIIPYPTANNVNFLVCNNTGAAVTPGAMTINWRVDR